MSSIKLDQEITDKLIRKAQNGHNFEIQEVPDNKEESVFTEEDFRNFEKELFCSQTKIWFNKNCLKKNWSFISLSNRYFIEKTTKW